MSSISNAIAAAIPVYVGPIIILLGVGGKRLLDMYEKTISQRKSHNPHSSIHPQYTALSKLKIIEICLELPALDTNAASHVALTDLQRMRTSCTQILHQVNMTELWSALDGHSYRDLVPELSEDGKKLHQQQPADVGKHVFKLTETLLIAIVVLFTIWQYFSWLSSLFKSESTTRHNIDIDEENLLEGISISYKNNLEPVINNDREKTVQTVCIKEGNEFDTDPTTSEEEEPILINGFSYN